MKRGIILVGAGNWGQSWLKFIHESVDWELSALVSRGGEHLQKAREAWNIPAGKCHPTLDEALKGPGDAVLITAPHSLHAPMAIQAMEAGRHALIEKPLSDDWDAARRIVDASNRTGLGAWVAQNFRNREGLWQLRRSVQAGSLGRVVSLRLVFRVGPKRKPPVWPQEWRQGQWSFLLNEIIIHHLDMARFLVGQDAEWISCHGWALPWSGSRGPDCAAAVAQFRDGVMFDYMGGIRGFCGPMTKFEGDWLIETDRGAAHWTGEAPEWDLGQDERGELLDAPGFPGFDRAGVLNDLAAALDNRPTAALPTAEENLPSMAMVFAAIRSFHERRPVELRDYGV